MKNRNLIFCMTALLIGILALNSCGGAQERRRDERREARRAARERPPETVSTVALVGTVQNHSLEYGGIKREFITYVPKSYTGERPVPVVTMFHGGGGTGKNALESTRWAEKAEREGFIAVFPEGSRPYPNKKVSFRRNKQSWNDGSGRYESGEKNVDDVGFVDAMLDDLSKEYSVDPRRIYAVGFSNGSSMVFRLAVELSDRIAAISPVSSSGLRLENPEFKRAVPMIYIHGTADPRNPIEGGDVKNYGDIDWRPPLAETVHNWARVNGCGMESVQLRKDGGVEAIGYRGCKDNADVDFYIVDGLGHTWPGGNNSAPEFLVGASSDNLNGTDVIWDFLDAHPWTE